MMEVRLTIERDRPGARPVVALETAVLTHGLPYPDNLETMARMVRAIEDAGAAAAVIGVKRGTPVVGLSPGEWEDLLDNPLKCQIRDLPFAAAGKRNGGTTVAATAYLAAKAGIDVFATGGIGGVHRGAEDTFDVSADLPALARLPLTVVSSGAKSILDLPRTVELLETLGVAVVGYRTRHFPGFYVEHTGIPLEQQASSPGEVAEVRRAMRALGLPGALLVVQPAPNPQDGGAVEQWIALALDEARQAGVYGKAVTPYLLGVLNRQAGASLKETNIALLEANAALAAAIAVEDRLDV